MQWLPNLVERLTSWCFMQNTKIIFLLRHQTKPILDYNISVINEAPRRPRSAGAPLNVQKNSTFFFVGSFTLYSILLTEGSIMDPCCEISGWLGYESRWEANYRVVLWGEPVICAAGIKHGGSGQAHDFYTNISGNGWQTLSKKNVKTTRAVVSTVTSSRRHIWRKLWCNIRTYPACSLKWPSALVIHGQLVSKQHV
jgi:hypothetical protein